MGRHRGGISLRDDDMRDIAIVTGVLVLKPIAELDEEKIAGGIIAGLDETAAEDDGSGE